MSKNQKRVLMTGASGFIGRHVLDLLLNSGYSVCAICNSHKLEPRKNLKIKNIDLFDYAWEKEFLEEEKFENLVHLAWYTGAKCHSINSNTDWVSASLALLKNFKNAGGKKVLMTGSVSEYDFSYGYMTEGVTPLNNPSLYGKCKAALFNIAEQYCKQNDIEFKWARVFNLYGDNEKENRLMPYVIRTMLKGEDVEVSPCTKFQDYSYVTDTAGAIFKLFESDVEGAVNICSGVPVRLKDIVEKIKELTNFKGNIHYGAIKANFEEPLVVGNNARLRDEVGYIPKVTLEQGLKNTINWWKEHDNV